jgi:hypothetical protein
LSSRRFSLKGWQNIAGGKPSAAIGTSPKRQPTLKGLQTTRHTLSPVSSDITVKIQSRRSHDSGQRTDTGRLAPFHFYANTRREDVMLIARLWPCASA